MFCAFKVLGVRETNGRNEDMHVSPPDNRGTHREKNSSRFVLSVDSKIDPSPTLIPRKRQETQKCFANIAFSPFLSVSSGFISSGKEDRER
jgi:hypothetical protein